MQTKSNNKKLILIAITFGLLTFMCLILTACFVLNIRNSQGNTSLKKWNTNLIVTSEVIDKPNAYGGINRVTTLFLTDSQSDRYPINHESFL